MTVTLNEAALDRAEKLIMDGEFVLDDRGRVERASTDRCPLPRNV
jgi:hypothetical protein